MSEAFYPLFPEAVQMTPKVARKVVQHAAQAKPAALAVIQGFSMITLIISNFISAAIAGGAAWYARGRGITGVKADVANIKTEVSNIKEKIHGRSADAAPAV